jgi:hypothetical protein
MKRPLMGSVFLIGRDRNVWNYGKDLIALKVNAPGNKFSACLVDALTPLYQYTFGSYHKVSWLPTVAYIVLFILQKSAVELLEHATNTVYNSDSTVYRMAAFIGTIVASLLPIFAIVVLYFKTTMPVRLGLVSIFTVIFSA